MLSNYSNHSTPNKMATVKNPLISNIINWGFVIVFLVLIVLAYYFIFYSGSMRFERFQNSNDPTATTNALEATNDFSSTTPFTLTSQNSTAYETALQSLFSDNTRIMCNMNPTLGTNVCSIDGVLVSRLHFPVQMIKMQDSSILAVFNDGRIYSKDTLEGNIWNGPLNNSLPNSTVPLRMITLTPDLSYLLGVGYDNQLYIRTLDPSTGKIDSAAIWKPVTNNDDVLYVIFDRDTKFMVTINTAGKLFIKTTSDIKTPNTEVTNPQLDRPLLRLFYDSFGYMLAIDMEFNLYQFNEKNWKKSGLNLKRGANPAQIHDVIYANDGKLVALVFQPDIYMLTTMKQSQNYYLSPFMPLNMLNSISGTSINGKTVSTYAMSDGDVISAKIGYINSTLTTSDNDTLDQDVVFAFNQQSLKDQQKLRTFCTSRYSTADGAVDNYDVLAQVEENNERILLLKDVLDNLIKYDPDQKKIQETFPMLYPSA